MMVKPKSRLKGLSLFANVGIAETYLHEVGVDVVVANELLPDRAKFYQHLYPKSDIPKIPAYGFTSFRRTPGF